MINKGRVVVVVVVCPCCIGKATEAGELEAAAPGADSGGKQLLSTRYHLPPRDTHTHVYASPPTRTVFFFASSPTTVGFRKWRAASTLTPICIRLESHSATPNSRPPYNSQGQVDADRGLIFSSR